MLIIHLIAGAMLFASFSLRMPQVSSTLSRIFTTFKSTVPVSRVQQNEDVFSISSTFVDPPLFCADVVSLPSPLVTNLVVHFPVSQYPDLGFTTDVNRSADPVIQETGQETCFPNVSGGEEKPVSNPAARLNILLLLVLLCVVPILYLAYRLRVPDLGFRTSTPAPYQSAGMLAAGNTTYFVIDGSAGTCFNSGDYLSAVFDGSPQIQLAPPSIPSTSDVTATIFDKYEPEEDPDKTMTPADDVPSVNISPMHLSLSPACSDCPSLTSDRSSGGESMLSPTFFSPGHGSPLQSPSPRTDVGYDDSEDYLYPIYDPFEDLEFDYSMYEDADEALEAISRRSHRKRYMVGLFPGVNESCLQRSAIPFDHFATTEHKCLDGPDGTSLALEDVRCCPYWYRCEKPNHMDGAPASETTRLLILNLNYSIVRDQDEARGGITRQVTVIYDSERLKSILGRLGATKMTVYCPANLQDYPYGVVDFPATTQSRAAFKRLQGQCLGYSGRHLRVRYVQIYDYTFGGRHVTSEDTREIMIVSLELKSGQLRSPKVLKRTPKESPSQTISPQKNKYSRMVVTKYGRRIQKSANLC